jgi:hypothetical protein
VTEQQLYLSIGIPSLVAILGILVNVSYFLVINARIQSLENRLDTRIGSMEQKFEILTGKVIEMDNRIVRLEERLKH